MEDSNKESIENNKNISINNENSSKKELNNINKINIIEIKNNKVDSNNIFGNVLSIELILNQIFQFMKIEDIKSLSLCNKKIYQSYCNQIKKIKIIEINKSINIAKIINKYTNINDIDLSECSYLSSISFLEKNKNIKELRLGGSYYIKDFSIISKLEKLEILDVGCRKISDISFLENNKNIIELDLSGCKIIKDYSFI